MEKIYHYTGLIFFWLIVVIGCLVVLYFTCLLVYTIAISKFMRRTWLVRGFKTFKVWYKYTHKNKLAEQSDPYRLEWMKKDEYIATMPFGWDKIWMEIIERKLTILREEITQHGETADF